MRHRAGIHSHPAGASYFMEPDHQDAPDSSVLSDRTHRARKTHYCDGCNEEILPGETYRLIVGVCDGEFGVLKYHMGGCPGGRDVAGMG